MYVPLGEAENWEVRSWRWVCRRGSWDVIALDIISGLRCEAERGGEVLIRCVLDLRLEALDAGA
jgi:hypothetical protein